MRPSRLAPLLLASLGLTLALALLAPNDARPDESGPTEAPPAADPFPIRRVLVSPERLTDPNFHRPGILVRRSRQEFEELVARAAKAQRQTPPRSAQLVEARYRATLVDNALVGSASWKIIQSDPQGGILPIPVMNFALRRLHGPDDRNLFLGDSKGNGPALFLDQPGEHLVVLDWSLRVNPLPAGLHCDLRLPPSAVATLELELPEDRIVTAIRDGCLVTGPWHATAAKHRLWRLSFPGQEQVDFMIRACGGPGRPPR
ncbi:MAG: hypothetical protein NZ700_09700, partial [Gemmataceae bacterium]|nr:hypothetical protein [Gemmataceae bacterium]MDW8266895.1 hypothetical protein [Gemmataceae bacterium]